MIQKFLPDTVTYMRQLLCISLATIALTAAFESRADNELQEILTNAEEAEQVAIEADYDGSLDDAESSIDVIETLYGVGLTADIRAAFSGSSVDIENESVSLDVLRTRWRLKGVANLTPYLRLATRIAGLCSTEECEPNLTWEDSIPTRNSMADGDITIDEAYFHWHRRERFDVAVGRMQTRFVARGGVFARSLDRNDSNNVNVNWTDGIHSTYRAQNGWNSHLILQHNSRDGASNVRRGNLDFSDSASRTTYFAAFENLERTPLFLQRGLDITYMPLSLLKDGDEAGRRVDYYAFVLRSANRWPERNEGIRVRVAAEIGYAPETPTRPGAGLIGSGDTDGLAWNAVISLMDFKPNHSIGINYGEVGAGWLISPQFRPNESSFEIRYQWRLSRELAFDARIRERRQLERSLNLNSTFQERDFFLRFTWGGTIR